ncbi:hypothetical protein K461DRAFT_316452 [Myriangium duriaei CBS 260.36]|uniref:Uncharacterized protein n=1 Tax=Myriangium duriaei CBS 260.36 TaxID=1168546 RepID=A0A9P4MHM6_9PEZI|nr:hypothetical protein K461DRAFT_316452 [Myriangium duriaei CBS 260.36]
MSTFSTFQAVRDLFDKHLDDLCEETARSRDRLDTALVTKSQQMAKSSQDGATAASLESLAKRFLDDFELRAIPQLMANFRGKVLIQLRHGLPGGNSDHTAEELTNTSEAALNNPQRYSPEIFAEVKEKRTGSHEKDLSMNAESSSTGRRSDRKEHAFYTSSVNSDTSAREQNIGYNASWSAIGLESNNEYGGNTLGVSKERDTGRALGVVSVHRSPANSDDESMGGVSKAFEGDLDMEDLEQSLLSSSHAGGFDNGDGSIPNTSDGESSNELSVGDSRSRSPFSKILEHQKAGQAKISEHGRHCRPTTIDNDYAPRMSTL